MKELPLEMEDRSFRDDDALAALVDEFTQRLQAGEAVSVEAFAARYPERSEEIRQLLPVLLTLERLDDSKEAGVEQTDADGQRVQALGDFRIHEEIGRGGMGIVYRAEQISLGRTVALKVLPFAAVLDPRQIQRFKNEAQAAAQLHHPSIVPVYSVGCERGVHYYAMQHIEGQSLASVIQELTASAEPTGEEPAADVTADSSKTPLEKLTSAKTVRSALYYRSVARIGRQAAEALDHAHEIGIVHRDIKPANLLLDVKGDVWITDFGLARCRADSSLTMSGDLLGTLRYMSPEQALAKRVAVDHRTDIYSLGVTLYELLTLKQAFPGTDREKVLRQIAFDDPPSPRKLNRSIPADLETILLKAMDKNAARRYETAADLAADLGRFLDDRPILARRPTPVERGFRWCRKHRVGVAASATVLTLSIAVAVLVTLHVERQRQALYEDDVLTAALKLGGVQLIWSAGSTFSRTTVEGHALHFQVHTEEIGLRNLLEQPVDDALGLLQEAVELYPRRPDAHYHLGRAYALQGMYGRALDSLDLALTCDKGFLPALLLDAVISRKTGSPARAEELEERAHSVAKEGWEFAWLRAHEAMGARQWEDAVAALDSLVLGRRDRTEPYLGFSIELYLGRGYAQMESGDPESAVESFSAAAALWPNSAQPRLLVALAYYLSGKEAKAERRLKDLAARPEFRNETALFASAMYQGRWELRDSLKWIREMDPSYIRDVLEAQLRYLLGEIDASIDAGKQAVELSRGTPNEALALAHLAVPYIMKGDIEEGDRFFEEAVKLAPRNAFIHHLRGYALLSQRDLWDEALDSMNRALDLDPEYTGPRINRSYVFTVQGDYERAIKECTIVLAQEPRNFFVLLNRGVARMYNGELLLAREDLEAAIKDSPKGARRNNSIVFGVHATEL